MTIEQFIEAAEQGGFNLPGGADVYTKIEEYLLNPKAWEAVIINLFKKSILDKDQLPLRQDIKDLAQAWMHNMITALCNGKTLSEYIAKL